MAKWKRYSLDFKRRAVEQMRKCAGVKALARKLKLARSLLYTWKYQLEGRPEKRRADLGQTRESTAEQQLQAENRLLKEAWGQRALEADFFAAALRRVEGQRRKSTTSGVLASTSKSTVGRAGARQNNGGTDV
jgi:transposase-like protein